MQSPFLFQNIKEWNLCFAVYNFASNVNNSFQSQMSTHQRWVDTPHFSCGSQALTSCRKSNLKWENMFSTEPTNLLRKGLSFWDRSQFVHSFFCPTSTSSKADDIWTPTWSMVFSTKWPMKCQLHIWSWLGTSVPTPFLWLNIAQT